MASFIEANEDVLEGIFNSDIANLMKIFHEKNLHWGEKTFETLATIQEFYTALLGLWLVDEYDPTRGMAWGLLAETVEFVSQNKEQFLSAKPLVTYFHNPTSMNPIQDLWAMLVGTPRVIV